MRSANRTVPSSPADSRIAGSIDLLSGTAVNDQIRKANQPLFTVNLASASIGTSMADCKPGALNCRLGIISNVAPTTESLIGVRLRWTDAGALDSTVIDTPLHGVSGLSRAISSRASAASSGSPAGRVTARSPSCSATWTVSRRSMMPTVTRLATRCWSRSPTG